MKNSIRLFAFALVVLGFATNAFAQIGVSDGAYAEAHIITPLTILKTVDLDFGNIGVIDQIGEVVLSTAGVRTGSGGATPAVPSGTVTAAEFDITGAPGQQVFVTIQGVAPLAASCIVTHTNGTDNMTVDEFITNPVSGFLLPAGGLQLLEVGATLNTGISQLPGDYHTLSDFVVTINYQ